MFVGVAATLGSRRTPANTALLPNVPPHVLELILLLPLYHVFGHVPLMLLSWHVRTVLWNQAEVFWSHWALVILSGLREHMALNL